MEKERGKLPTKTTSDIPIEQIYGPEHLAGFNAKRDLGEAGEDPFTRGIYPNMYRGRLWTMRQFAGFATAEETNKRFRYLLEHGQTGLSVAFDFPTLNGYDSDHPRAFGEVGKCGVAVSSLEDMEIIFSKIPLDKVTTSMTINAPAIAVLSMYLAVAEKQGAPLGSISGTTQNDLLKEFMAQKSFILPPQPSVKLVVDIIKFCMKHVPKWHPVSISGYHIREAGATAVQELAFTLANGITYVQSCVEEGLKVDDFAPRLSFFFACHNNFFEEVAKFRAARRIWAKVMKERFHAKKHTSRMLRFHTQTSGCALTAQQPEVNLIRVALQAFAAVLGGTQSLHTNSYDEALALPSEEAVRLALRTQQIIAYESGVTATVDPLGGSFFLERLTSEVEEKAWEYLDRIEKMGGVVKGIEAGFFQSEIADSAYRHQKGVESGEIPVVGVNLFSMDESSKMKLLRVSSDVERRQTARLKRLRERRDKGRVAEALRGVRKAAEEDQPIMPKVFEAVKAYVTVGEILGAFREVYGEYEERLII